MIITATFKKNGEYGGRKYSYICDHEAQPGELVTDPNGNLLRAEEINVPEESVEAFKDKLKSVYRYEKPEVVTAINDIMPEQTQEAYSGYDGSFMNF